MADVQIVLDAQDRASKTIGNVETKLLGMTKSARLLKRESRGVSTFANAIDQIAGTNFGSTILGLTTIAEVAHPLKELGGAIQNKLTDALHGIQNNPAVAGASSRLGSFMGSNIGVGLGITAGVAIGVELDRIWNEQITALHGKMGELKTVLATDSQAAATAAQSPWLGLANVIGQGLSSIPITFTQELGSDLQGVNGIVQDAAQKVGESAATGVQQGFAAAPNPLFAYMDALKARVPLIAAGVDRAFHIGVATTLDNDMREQQKRVEESARGIGNSLAGGIRDAKKNVSDAMDDLVFMIKHPLAVTHEVAHLEGLLTGKRLQEGLHSKNKDIHDQAVQTQGLILAQLANLRPDMYQAGVAGANALERGLNSFDPPRHLGTVRVGGREVVVGRAAGGPLSPGQWSVVGERGPELIRAGRQGATVAPNSALGGGSGDVYLDGTKVGVVLDRRQGRQMALATYSNVSR